MSIFVALTQKYWVTKKKIPLLCWYQFFLVFLINEMRLSWTDNIHLWHLLVVKYRSKPKNLASSYYKSTSLLPTLGKLFEKLIVLRIPPILHEHQIIPNHPVWISTRTSYNTPSPSTHWYYCLCFRKKEILCWASSWMLSRLLTKSDTSGYYFN